MDKKRLGPRFSQRRFKRGPAFIVTIGDDHGFTFLRKLLHNAAPNAVNPAGASTITTAVLDANGNPVPNTEVDFTFTATGSASGVSPVGQPMLGQVGTTPLTLAVATPLKAYTDINGLARVAYLAGPANGTDTIKAAIPNTAYFSTTSITVSTASTVVGSIVTTVGSNSIPVGGTTTIFATVKTAGGAPVPGVTVSFSASNGTPAPTSATTDANGIALSTLTAGTDVLTATITSSAGGYSSSTSVNYTAGAVDTVAVSAAPGAVKPGGISTISALALDIHGNPVVGETVTFSITIKNSGQPTLSSATALTNVNGLASVTYTAGSSNGTDTIKALSSNAKTNTTTVAVNTSSIVVSSLVLTSGAATLPTGGSCAAITATLTDNAGLPASGVQVGFTTTAGTLNTVASSAVPASSTLGPITSTTTGANGAEQVYLCSGNNLATATVTASASGFAQQTSVTFVAGSPSSISLLATPATVSTGGISLLAAVVRDAQNNPVAGQTVSFAFTAKLSGSPTLSAATGVTDGSGVASVTYTAGNTPSVTDTVSATVANVAVKTVDIAVSTSPTLPATLTLSANPATVKSDNSNTTTVTVTALNANNAAMQNVIVTLGSAITTDLSGASGVAA